MGHRQMNKISCYNGILYKIEYKPELSQKDYTQRHVYHIKTNERRMGDVD